LEFNHVNFNNINIYGDLNESSFINIKMGDNKNVLKFEDVNITNLNSNGQIINYTGNNIYIDFINVHCNNLISFSPLLKGNSENVWRINLLYILYSKKKLYIYICVYIYIYIYIFFFFF